MFIHHNQTLKLSKNAIFFSVTAAIFTAFLAFLALNFLQPFAPESSYAETHTDDGSATYSGTNYSLSTTVSDLDLTLNALPSGNSTYGAQTVSVTTTAPGGYQLYMNTSGSLASSVDSTTIPSVTGSNVALSTNTWGYTSTTPDADGDIAGAQTIWNAAPTTITQVDSTNTTATNRQKTLYYGVKADNTLTDGNYNGTITYTTVANADSSNGLLVTRNGSGYAGENNNTLTITTPLMTKTTLANSDVTVTITNSSSTSYTCTVSSVSTSTGVLVVNCSIPTTATASTYSVSVTVSKYGKTYTKASAFSLSTFTLSISSATPATANANTSTSMTITINRSSPSATTAQYGSTNLSNKSNSGSNITGTIGLAAGTYTLTVTATWNGKTYTATKSSALVVSVPDLTNATMQSSDIATRCKNSTETTSTSNYKSYQLTDSRDSQKYYVRKFTFNNTKYCMMVQNLYLTGGTQLTSSTSNVSTTWSLPSSSTSGFSRHYTSAKMYNGSRYSGSGNNDGSYYSWCAATAGTGGCYGTNQAAGTYDICPKYWRLPTNTEMDYIKSRINSIGNNTFFSGTDGSVHAPIYPGYYDDGSSYAAGAQVYWWSSTQYSNNAANGLSVYYTTGSLSAYSLNKYYGESVRCLVQAAS